MWHSVFTNWISLNCQALGREACLSILKPMTVDHVEAESAAIVSGIATPEPNLAVACIVHAAVAALAIRKVNSAIFTLAICRKAVTKKNIETGYSMKNATEA